MHEIPFSVAAMNTNEQKRNSNSEDLDRYSMIDLRFELVWHGARMLMVLEQL